LINLNGQKVIPNSQGDWQKWPFPIELGKASASKVEQFNSAPNALLTATELKTVLYHNFVNGKGHFT
jgi:hypothetical protein